MITQANSPAETRSVLENIKWSTFVALSEQRRGSVPRMTYDRGLLELMSPHRQHEEIGRLIGRLFETYTEVFNIEIASVASTTFKRKDLKRAFEADESYYIQHAEQMRGKLKVDLAIHPPPDLVIEIEITSSAIRKLKLFAAMSVPEVWRHDGERFWMYRLSEGKYESVTASGAVPSFTLEMVEGALAKRFEIGETAWVREFRNSLLT